MKYFKKMPDDDVAYEDEIVLVQDEMLHGFLENDENEEEIVDREIIYSDNDNDNEGNDPNYSPESPDSNDLWDENVPGTSGLQRNLDECSSDDSDEDELVVAIKNAKTVQRKSPPDIALDDLILDISFHPGGDVLAIGTHAGDVYIYKYDLEGNELCETLELHKKSCRCLEYNQDGSILFSGGKDKTIMLTDTETGKLKQFYDGAHEDIPCSLYIFKNDENLFSTGDEGGVVKVWDLRKKVEIAKYKAAECDISKIISNEQEAHLVCCAGDFIVAYDLAAGKLFMQSEQYEDEFTSLGVFKRETKLIASSSRGRFYVFNWGEFGYHSDILPGNCKANITCLIPITENIVVSGYDDGACRATNLYPHRELGIVGQHDFPIDAIDISHDGRFVATTCYPSGVKFWDIKYFEDVHVEKEKVRNKRKDLRNNLPSSNVQNPSDFFADLS